MILVTEIDHSKAFYPKGEIPLFVAMPIGPTRPLKVIGKWKRQRFQYLSMREKRKFMIRWRAGDIQKAEFLKVFGQPCFDTATPPNVMYERPIRQLTVVRSHPPSDERDRIDNKILNLRLDATHPSVLAARDWLLGTNKTNTELQKCCNFYPEADFAEALRITELIQNSSM